MVARFNAYLKLYMLIPLLEQKDVRFTKFLQPHSYCIFLQEIKELIISLFFRSQNICSSSIMSMVRFWM